MLSEWKMSGFENALIEASEWLNIPGVETIIPNPADRSFTVLVSCSTLLLSGLIPEKFMGYMVNFYYVHGLRVNNLHKQNNDDNFTTSASLAKQ